MRRCGGEGRGGGWRKSHLVTVYKCNLAVSILPRAQVHSHYPPLQREIEKQRNATKMHGWRLHCVQLSGAGRDPIETLAAIEANKIHAVALSYSTKYWFANVWPLHRTLPSIATIASFEQCTVLQKTTRRCTIGVQLKSRLLSDPSELSGMKGPAGDTEHRPASSHGTSSTM